MACWRVIQEVLGAIAAPLPEASVKVNNFDLQDAPQNNVTDDKASETAQEAAKVEPDNTVLALEGMLTDDSVLVLAKTLMAEDKIDLDSIVCPMLLQLGHTLSKAT